MRTPATRFVAAASAFAALFTAAGCVFLDVKEQQEKLAETCRISGSVSTARAEPRPIVVILLRNPSEEPAVARGAWQVADHFVLERPGRWGFATGPGRYAVAAFEDRSRDLIYQPGEPYGATGFDRPLTCTPGAGLGGIAVSIPARVRDPFPHALDIPTLEKRGLVDQAHRTMGQLSAVGELASLSDPRFSQQNAEDALWRPFDFLVHSWAGVYFLEPYDPRRIPVLFVHGISGTPASFEFLAANLDRTRFQPWVYYYPSGLSMRVVADHLDQTMAKLQLRYGFSRFAVVAHSMGGLVSRGFIVRHAQAARSSRIPLYVTISTPWGGHKAAESGVKNAPVVVEVWRDMAPGSEYQRSVFARPLPAGMQHHLLFTFQRKSASFGESDDQSVTVASQLVSAAQANAVRVYGFDDTHVGVLRNPEVSALLNQLLARSFQR